MKISSGDVNSGDVNIMILKAYKADGSQEADYKEYVTEVHIFESILSPAIYCALTIKDAINISEYFRLGIGDLVHIKFQTPGAADTCEYVFKVNTPEINKTRSPNLAFDVYTTELVSVQAIAAFQDETANMEGFDLKDTAGNIIKRILDEKIAPLGDVVKAAGLREYRVGQYIDTGHGIIGRNRLQASRLPKNSDGAIRKPFEVIHQLALLNNMSPEGHSLYTFFEREDGYWFKPIEKLMEDGKKLIEQGLSDKIFYYDHLRNQDASAVKFRNILAFSILNNDGRDSHVNTESRNLNSEAAEELSASFTPSDADINITNLTSAQTLNEFNGVTRSDVTTSTEYDHLNRVIVNRTRLLSRITQFEAQVMIYGDTNMAAGDVIECNFPQATGAVQENIPSKDSGYYLVTHLRHMILNTDRPQHAISCSLMRAEPPREL
jgi:hypothetical protein